MTKKFQHWIISFAQADGITIEALQNSTKEPSDEEYDEYYDIWEGEIFKRNRNHQFGQGNTMKTTTTRQMWPQSRESTLSSTERKETRSRKRKRTNPVTRFPRTSIVISSTLSIKSENALKRIEMKSWTNFPRRCILYTFLDAWRYDEDLILSASQQEILDVVNLLERRCTYFFQSFLC